MVKKLSKTKPEDSSLVVEAETQADKVVEANVNDAKSPKAGLLAKVAAFLKTKRGKLVAAIVGIAVLLGLVFAIPFTRYAVLGTVVNKSVVVTVTDSTTNKPVTEALVEIAGKSATTDASGQAKIDSVPVGSHTAKVTKAYYNEASQSVLVPVFSDATSTILVQATGRQVPAVVVNKISGKPVANALIEAGEASTKTNDKGEAILVLPADQQLIKATIKTPGYNDAEVEITVTELLDDANKLSIVPSGKVFYSSATGIFSVNLDGSSKKELVKSSGHDSTESFMFKVSPNRQQIALKSWRTGESAKLYLVNTDSGELTTIDDRKNVAYTLFGWSGDRVIYSVTRQDMNEWEPKREVLKSYQPSTNAYVTLDENTAVGEFNNVALERFREARFLGNEIVYIKDWLLPHGGTGDIVASKRISLMSVHADGSSKKLLIDMNNHYFMHDMQIIQYGPKGIYVYLQNENKYASYQGGAIKEDSSVVDKFYGTYDLRVSPNGEKSSWTSSSGLSYIGDGNGGNATSVAELSEYRLEGWATDEYLLVSDNFTYRDLYIVSADGDGVSAPLEIANIDGLGY